MTRETVVLRGVTCVVLECGTCGVPFTVPQVKYQANLDEGGYQTCPNGHTRGWDKSASQRERDRQEQERIRQERDRLKQNEAYLNDEIARQERLRKDAERAATAAKGQVTKLKKRASAGVCPCCNRTFQQLAKHMAAKHPTFIAEPLPGDGVSKH